MIITSPRVKDNAITITQIHHSKNLVVAMLEPYRKDETLLVLFELLVSRAECLNTQWGMGGLGLDVHHGLGRILMI